MASSADAGMEVNPKEGAIANAERDAFPPVRQQQSAIFSTYSAVATVYCAVFSWVFFTAGGSVLLGWIHAGALLAVVGNWIVYRNDVHSARPIRLILATGTTVVASLFATGGWEGTGYLWTFGYLPYATFLPEKKQGMFWVLFLCAIDCLLALAARFRVPVVPYSDAQLFNFFACYLVFAVCIYLFKDALEKSEQIILRDTEALRVGKEVDRAKSEFVALVSHQLRTPLTVMAWSLERFNKTDLTRLPQQAQDDVHAVRYEIGRMSALINDILDVSRLEAGKIVIQPYDIDIVAAAKTAAAEVAPAIHAQRLAIVEHYPPSLIVRADPILLHVILINLLSNAVKYTPSGGTVTLAVESSERSVIISVADTGYGIPVDEQPKVFNKLFRGGRAMKVDAVGTGLGLYITKAIVTEAGGTIKFNSEEGKGTRFSVTFPREGMRPQAGNVHLREAPVENSAIMS